MTPNALNRDDTVHGTYYYLADEADKIIDELKAERDALRADAERYRWLREQDDTSPLFCMYGSNGPWGECGHSDIYGELLDKSIDEEMKGKS